MKLKTTLFGNVYQFKDVKEVLAKANELRSGDVLAGVAATSSQERVAAKQVLSTGAPIALQEGLVNLSFLIITAILNGLAEGEIPHVEDYKTELQERVQRRAGQTLSYTVCAESGPDHNKTFTMAVLLNGSEIGRGTGRTKKEAEQSAARCALEQMPQ